MLTQLSLGQEGNWLPRCEAILEKAHIYALIQALQLSKGKKTNIYTDSRYAFATLHVHRALYKERGLLTASEKDSKNKEEIKTLLDAAWEPERVAVIHCRGYRIKDTPRAWVHGAWVGKTSSRRKRQPTPVFMPEKFHE